LAATFNTPPSETRDAQLGGLNRRVVRRIDWAIFLTVLVASLYVLPRWADPNQNSRLDMVVAVVDDHTFRIDNYVHNTVDYARVGDAYYSDKAPGAALLGIPLYAVVDPVLDAVLGEDVTGALANAPAFQATLRADGTGVSTEKLRFAALQVLLAALVAALPTALAAVLVWRLALRFTGAPGASALSALAYGLLTPVFAYSNAVYGHQLAAFLLIGAFALLALGPPRAGALRLLLLGVLLGYAVVSEYPAAVPAGFIFLYAAWRLWQAHARLRLGWTMLAGGAVAAGWMSYNSAIFGGPLALGYSHSELWTEQHSTGFMSLSLPTLDGIWGITFSAYRGLFLLSPWLLLALPGFVIWWRWGRARAEWWVTLACALSMFAFNASSHMWWGGFAVGPRYVLPALPFLALAAAATLAQWAPSRAFRWSTAVLMLWSLLATWGMALANQAYPPDTLRNPWLSYALPAWQDGNIARNLGTIGGLPGSASLLPLLLIAALGSVLVVSTLRAQRVVVHSSLPAAAPAAPAAPSSALPTGLKTTNPEIH
jgi:hypothetical protein